MYGGVEYHPLPQEVYDTLASTHPKMQRFKSAGLENIALSTRIMTRQACQRIIRGGFEFARKNKRKSVTVVDKPNVLRETGGLMMQTARAVAKEYPDVPLYETNIDAMCMFMIKDPTNYDVIVAENMFGDILSDLAAQMVGGLGFAPTGNVGDSYAVFEPSHGSAPKYTGHDRVNPIAMMLSAELMLRHLGEGAMADAVNGAISRVVRDRRIAANGKIATKDFGGTASATQLTDAIIAAL